MCSGEKFDGVLAKMVLDSALEMNHDAGGEIKLSLGNMLITFNH